MIWSERPESETAKGPVPVAAVLPTYRSSWLAFTAITAGLDGE